MADPGCPCCDGPMVRHDTIEAGALHRTEKRGTWLWTIWRCATCAEDSAPSCTCEDEGIYNDRDGQLEAGYGCAL